MRNVTCGLIVLCVVLLNAAPVPAAAEEAETITVYGDAVGQDAPPVGWRFTWNKHGVVHDPANGAPLQRIAIERGRGTRVSYGVPDGAGGADRNQPRLSQRGAVYAATDADGVRRYAIASYTMQRDAAGEVWVNHGNLLNGGNTDLLLKIYVDDELRHEARASPGNVPLLFRTKLGRLHKGEVIRVAVGAEAGIGGGKLRFVIEQVPRGAQPNEPVNILAPRITEAAPKRDNDGGHDKYARKHLAQCRRVLEWEPRLVFLGDSITARLPERLLAKRYPEYRPVNLGVGGDWTQNVLWRVRNGVLDRAPIEVAVLMIGTNNISHGYTADGIAKSIGRIVDAIHEKVPKCKVLVLGIFPRGRSAPDSRANRKARAVNDQLATMADGEKVFFLDIGDAFTDADGTVPKKIMPDGLHVAGPGFKRWLDAMDPTLRKLLPDAAPKDQTSAK